MVIYNSKATHNAIAILIRNIVWFPSACTIRLQSAMQSEIEILFVLHLHEKR